MDNIKVLVYDDDEIYKSRLINLLKSEGCSLEIVDDGLSIQNRFEKTNFDFIIVSDVMPSRNGKAIMEQLLASNASVPVFYIHSQVNEQIKRDYSIYPRFETMKKPFKADDYLTTIRRLIDEIKERASKNAPSFDEVIKGSHSTIKNVFEMIEKVAETDSTVLITGESGTGKELIARAIHHRSKRRKNLMVAVNCGAIPENLLESELFGHVKGAYTGASYSREGRFLQADKGSIFLDEIGEMSLPMQVKLLRILQERSFEPVGGSTTVSVDVRIIAATNKDIELMVDRQTFRNDLFYRLNVVPIHLPRLADRKSDIPLLTEYFINTFNMKNTRRIGGVTSKAMTLLIDYSWPGNVRELENLIERISIMKGEGEIEVEDLPEKIKFPGMAKSSTALELTGSGIDLNETLEQIENNLIIQAMNLSNGNKQQAANLLRINRTTLVEKLKKKRLIEE